MQINYTVHLFNLAGVLSGWLVRSQMKPKLGRRGTFSPPSWMAALALCAVPLIPTTARSYSQTWTRCKSPQGQQFKRFFSHE